MTRRLSVIMFLASSGVAAYAGPYVGRTELRSAAQAGTSTLSGVVVSDETTRAPVAGAIVTLTADGQPVRSQVTGEDGKFAFVPLPAARYTATASKPAYVTNMFGAKHPGGPGTTIALGAGQVIGDLRIVLPRGAAVTGTIRDLTGTPARGARVSLVPVTSSSRLVALSANRSGPRNASVLTDDRGIYRAWGLTPGTYVVVVDPPSAFWNEARTMTANEMSAALRDLQARGAAAAADSAPAGTPVTFAPIYFPGTTNLANATPISLGAGEERAGVDVTQTLAKSATISGTVTGADGAASIPMTVTRDDLWPDAPIMFTPGFLPTAAANGQFSFGGVSPGHYIVAAHTGSAPSVVGPQPPPSKQVQWASTEIDVNGENISGLSLSLRPGLTVSGRVAFEAGGTPAPTDLTKMRVALRLRTMTPDRPGGDAAFASVGRDGSFTLPMVLPGQYVLSATMPNDGLRGWWLKSATAENVNLADAPFELSSGDLAGVVVTFTDRHTGLSGALLGPAGQPAAEYFIIAFAADGAFRTTPSRRVRITRPATDGRYAFTDLPAGDYLVAVVPDVDGNAWQESAFLESLVTQSVRVTVADGAVVTRDLRIGR